MPYAILILVLLLGGSSYLLKNQYEVTGKQELELEQTKGRITAMTIGFASQLAERNTALLTERKAREQANKRTQNAETRLNAVKTDGCYDSPIPDGAALGVQQALNSYTGTLQIGDPRHPAATGSPTCRELANYFPRIVGALEKANGQLRSISGMGTN